VTGTASESIVEFSDGSFSGPVKAGKADGRGVTTWKAGEFAGDRFEGEYVDNRMHGTGVYVLANGDRYEGGFVDDKQHGSGVYGWANGDRYEGQWTGGNMHGTGLKTWAGGARYEGGWADDRTHGGGIFWLADGIRCFDGEWRKDFARRGTAVEADGSFFLAELDGKTVLNFEEKYGRWRRAGRVEGWPLAAGAAGGLGGATEWTGAVTWADGRRFEGRLRGLRPVEGVETGAGGTPAAVTYGAGETLAEIEPRERAVSQHANTSQFIFLAYFV
jgi:hypothetical protein